MATSINKLAITATICSLDKFITDRTIADEIQYSQNRLVNALGARFDDRKTLESFVFEDCDPLDRNETATISSCEDIREAIRDIQHSIIAEVSEIEGEISRNDAGQVVARINANQFNDILGALPPLDWTAKGFLLSAPYSTRVCSITGEPSFVYSAFAKVGADYYRIDHVTCQEWAVFDVQIHLMAYPINNNVSGSETDFNEAELLERVVKNIKEPAMHPTGRIVFNRCWNHVVHCAADPLYSSAYPASIKAVASVEFSHYLRKNEPILAVNFGDRLVTVTLKEAAELGADEVPAMVCEYMPISALDRQKKQSAPCLTAEEIRQRVAKMAKIQNPLTLNQQYRVLFELVGAQLTNDETVITGGTTYPVSIQAALSIESLNTLEDQAIAIYYNGEIIVVTLNEAASLNACEVVTRRYHAAKMSAESDAEILRQYPCLTADQVRARAMHTVQKHWAQKSL